MRPPQRNNPRTDTATIHDPLGAYPEQFHKHLERQHYSPATIIAYTHCLNALGRQMQARHVDLKDLDEEFAVELIAHAEPLSSHRKHHHFIVRRCIAFLTPLGVVKLQREAPLDDTVRGRLKRDYEAYLRHQRGLSESTICASWRVADHFLTFHFGQEVGALAALTATDTPPLVWLHTPERTPWAVLHVVRRHRVGLADVIVLVVQVPRQWLQHAERGLWTCDRVIAPARLSVWASGYDVAASPISDT